MINPIFQISVLNIPEENEEKMHFFCHCKMQRMQNFHIIQSRLLTYWMISNDNRGYAWTNIEEPEIYPSKIYAIPNKFVLRYIHLMSCHGYLDYFSHVHRLHSSNKRVYFALYLTLFFRSTSIYFAFKGT